MNAFKDHFSGHAAGYAAFRPRYPAALVDYLADQAPATEAAWDCGCGSGQLSTLLAGRFARVVATDASAEQIAEAEPHPRVAYTVAPAERSGLPDASADLITVAQAAHWFDLPAFYAECRRVGRPGAVVALVTYATMSVSPEIDELIEPFYKEVIGPYWPPERRLVEEGYRTLPFPFAELEPPAIAMQASWTREQVLGYIETWSAVQRMAKAVGTAPLQRFRDAVAAAWQDNDRRRTVTWPLGLRVGRL